MTETKRNETATKDATPPKAAPHGPHDPLVREALGLPKTYAQDVDKD